ncbi:hypothetical protein F5880DRAFT_1488460, partial [Lentinula raphanica]
WLAAPDYSIHFATAFNKRVDGTGQWIFEDPTYLEWKENAGILWIQGKAGSGKTVLITGIINELREMESSSLIICHYFDTRDNTGANTSYQGFLLSLLLQMGAQDNRIHPALKKLHESLKHGLSHSKPTNSAIADTLKAITQDLTQKQHQIYIIIDALDECVSKDESMVLNFLALFHQSFPVKIMISSRNHHHFEGKNCWTVFMSSNNNVDGDIATYVENQLQFVFESTNLATLKDEVKAILMRKADGGFRYIDCQLQTLGDCGTTAMIKKELALLPLDLQETYAEAIKKSKKSNYAKEIYHILLWLLHSFEPLNLKQVAIICSIDLESLVVDYDAQILGGLEKIISTTLVTTDKDGVVQLAHASVKEFLLKNHDNNRELFEINAYLAHNIIAQMCIIYLLQQCVHHEIWTQHFYYHEDVITFEQYATQYWAEHTQYNESAEVSCEHTMKLTETFLKDSSILSWKRNYSQRKISELIEGFQDFNILDIIAFFGLQKSAKRLVDKDSVKSPRFHIDVQYELKAIFDSGM